MAISVPGPKSFLSLDSVTRVRESGTVFSNPLANDLQKIMQEINDLHKATADLAATIAAGGKIPVSPTAVSDFTFPPEPAWRDDGAMDVVIEALALASSSAVRVPPSQIIVCTQPTYPVLTGVDPVFVYVTDYAHLIYWNGLAGGFVGDNPGCLSLWENDPGVGYHLYDGSIVNYLKADGTISSIVLPDLTSSAALAAFLEGGSPNSGPTAATAPTLLMNPYTPAGLIGAQILVGTPAALTTAAVTATGAVNAITQIAGSGTSYTPAGTVTTGVFSGTPATLTGTVSATGEPRKVVRRPYFRQ